MNQTTPPTLEHVKLSTTTSMNINISSSCHQQSRTCFILIKQMKSCLCCRHYGPMVFYYCWTKGLDDYLSHLVWSGRTGAAREAISVYVKIHSGCKLAALDLAAASDEEVIRSFAKLESLKPGKVNMALDKLLEDRQNEETLLSGHGAK